MSAFFGLHFGGGFGGLSADKVCLQRLEVCLSRFSGPAGHVCADKVCLQNLLTNLACRICCQSLSAEPADKPCLQDLPTNFVCRTLQTMFVCMPTSSSAIHQYRLRMGTLAPSNSVSGIAPSLPSAHHRRIQSRNSADRTIAGCVEACHTGRGGTGLAQATKGGFSTSTLHLATYSQNGSRQQGHQMTSNRPNNTTGHQMTSNRPNIATVHQTTSNCLSDTAGFQRSRRNNLMVLRSRRLRHETPTAEEATKN